MAVQKRNDEMVDILKADFVDKNNPHGYWHGHRMSTVAGFPSFVIPGDHTHVLAWLEIVADTTLEIEAGGVLLLIG